MPASSTKSSRAISSPAPLRSRGASSPRSARWCWRETATRSSQARVISPRSTRPPRIIPSAPRAEGATRRRRGIAGRHTLPVADALKRERDSFLELVAGDQSKAQRHIFFAEREAAKVPDIAGVKAHDHQTSRRDRRRHHGGRHCHVLANAGIPVTVVETGAEALSRGLDAVTRNYRNTAARGGLGTEEMEARIARITGTTDLAAVADADLVVEAVFEDMGVKQDVFAGSTASSKPAR